MLPASFVLDAIPEHTGLSVTRVALGAAAAVVLPGILGAVFVVLAAHHLLGVAWVPAALAAIFGAACVAVIWVLR